MSSANINDSVKHSQPIPINTRHGRRRSCSDASTDSSDSSASPPQPVTPPSNTTPPRMLPPNLSPTSSPILSYFMAQSPTKSTFLSRKFGPAPVFEEEEEDNEIPVARHARRASTAGAGRFGQPPLPAPPLPDASQDRGTALLRRLSLGNAFVRAPNGTTERVPSPPRPATPPNTAVSPTMSSKMPSVTAKGTRAKRSATLNVDGGGRPRRAPSPMGERILKGHFDSFH